MYSAALEVQVADQREFSWTNLVQ